ncbi:hypothetical protein HAX54_019115 [Datura stramonium]|uniref:Transposase n=1 Tax=Datura stramonium TaxID=4076 RepID=A0ABS8UQI1_DATST|nr:hypothetical protein [Datura stramonium]
MRDTWKKMKKGCRNEEEYDVVVEEEEGRKRKRGSKETKSFLDHLDDKGAIACKRIATDRFRADIFKSGQHNRPKYPYFVAKIQPNKRYQVHVPINVVRDNKLELPSSMTIRDFLWPREFETKLNSWKDGRIWLIGGWCNLFGVEPCAE